jgi:hypothetical protein
LSSFDYKLRKLEHSKYPLSQNSSINSGQPPDDLLREAKNTGQFFKHVASIYPGSEARNGTGSAYRILSEDEIEAVSFDGFLEDYT